MYKCPGIMDKQEGVVDKVGSEGQAATSRPFSTLVPTRIEEAAYCSTSNLMKLLVLGQWTTQRKHALCTAPAFQLC